MRIIIDIDDTIEGLEEHAELEENLRSALEHDMSYTVVAIYQEGLDFKGKDDK